MSDPLSPSPLIHIGNTIQVISNFTALTAGVPGNVLVILVMTRPSMRTNSASFYFTILAFSDLGVVLSATPSDLLGWNRFGTGNSYSVFTCILTLYVIRVCGGTSLWLLVALGIDRLIAVRLPLKAKQFCTVQRASLVSSLILFLMLLRNLPVLWMRGEQILSGPENTTTVINCGYTSEEAYDYSTRINPLFSLIAVGLLPVGSATVINILIINELRKMHRFRQEHGSEGGETKNRSLAVMLVTASVLMTVLVTPNLTTITLIPHVMNTASPDYFTKFLFLRKVTAALATQNYAINFFLYCLCGSRFRTELCKMFKCCSTAKPTQSSSGRAPTASTISSISTGIEGPPDRPVTEEATPNDNC